MSQPADSPPSSTSKSPAAVPKYRFSVSEFLRAWEVGAFDSRVELIEGEVWPVVIGGWHGKAVMRLARLLAAPGVEVTSATLPSGGSLPDPDCWVSRLGATPTGVIGARVETWAPSDVLLVVEVSDETLMADLTTKARIYGAAGWPVYWVVSPETVYVHSEPHPQGYGLRREFRPGARLTVSFADAEIAVDDLIGSPEPV